MSASQMAHYPQGFAGGFSVRGTPLVQTHAGKVFWVSNSTALQTGQRGGSNGNKGTFDSPFATLDYAIGQCTANRGDVIFVKPGHAETITGAGGITADVAGVSIIGLGSGSARPRFLMDGGTAVTFVISAADVHVENMIFAGGHNGIVTCFSVGAINATLKNIEFEDNTTDEHFLSPITAPGADASANGLSVIGCKWVTVDAGATDFVGTTGSIAKLTMKDNLFIADAATGAGMLIMATGKVATGLEFVGNTMICGNTAGDLLIDNDAATNTGYAAWNFVGHHDVAAQIAIDCDGIRLWNNFQASSDTESGVLIPAADTNT